MEGDLNPHKPLLHPSYTLIITNKFNNLHIKEPIRVVGGGVPKRESFSFPAGAILTSKHSAYNSHSPPERSVLVIENDSYFDLSNAHTRYFYPSPFKGKNPYISRT